MASGDSLLIFTPSMNEPPATNYATLDLRNQHPVLDFDASTNEDAIFSAVMPRNYSGGGVTVYIHYSMSTATSGDIDWDVSFERIGDSVLDIDADSFATAVTVDDTTVPGTSGYVDVVNIVFTDGVVMDSVAASELFRIKVTRATDTGTATGDAELHAVEIKET